MKVTYICDICGDLINTVTIDQLDEGELGLDSLTEAEKESIINYTNNQGMVVYALCDDCAGEMGLDESWTGLYSRPELH